VDTPRDLRAYRKLRWIVIYLVMVVVFSGGSACLYALLLRGRYTWVDGLWNGWVFATGYFGLYHLVTRWGNRSQRSSGDANLAPQEPARHSQ